MKKKRTNPYKEANEALLTEKAKEGGIIVLDNGVTYPHLHASTSQDRTLMDRTMGFFNLHFSA